MQLNRFGYILRRMYEAHYGLELSIVDLADDLDFTKEQLLCKIQGQEPSSSWLKAQQVKLARKNYPMALFFWSDDVLYIETARRIEHATIKIVDATRPVRDASSIH